MQQVFSSIHLPLRAKWGTPALGHSRGPFSFNGSQGFFPAMTSWLLLRANESCMSKGASGATQIRGQVQMLLLSVVVVIRELSFALEIHFFFVLK